MSNKQILSDIEKERERQDVKWGGVAHDDEHTTAEFVQLIQDYAGRARTMAGMNSPDKARNRLIQVAALAVAAVESIDRKEATKRYYERLSKKHILFLFPTHLIALDKFREADVHVQ